MKNLSKTVFNQIQKIDFDIQEKLKESNSLSLLEGISGIALFYINLYNVTKEDGYLLKAQNIINSILSDLTNGEEKVTHSYNSGFAGIAHLLNFLQKKGLLSENVDDFLEQLDGHLIEEANLLINKYKDLDFLHGALGIGVYFLSRYGLSPTNDPEIKKVLYSLVKLIEQGCIAPQTVNFFGNHYINGKERIDCFNMGIAHGGASYIIYLRNYINLFPESKYPKKVLEVVIQKMLSYYKPIDERLETEFAFPGIPTKGKLIDYNTPLGWCYGDLSISIALFHAGKILEKDNLMSFAQMIAKETIPKNTLEKAYIRDACFCHGTSSIAKAYQLWYEQTGDVLFKYAHEHWIKLTINEGYHNDGIGGYKKFMGIDTNSPHSSFKYEGLLGLLDGSCGIGLVLTDYLDSSTLKWEQFLLWY